MAPRGAPRAVGVLSCCHFSCSVTSSCLTFLTAGHPTDPTRLPTAPSAVHSSPGTNLASPFPLFCSFFPSQAPLPAVQTGNCPEGNLEGRGKARRENRAGRRQRGAASGRAVMCFGEGQLGFPHHTFGFTPDDFFASDSLSPCQVGMLLFRNLYQLLHKPCFALKSHWLLGLNNLMQQQAPPANCRRCKTEPEFHGCSSWPLTPPFNHHTF